MCHEVTSVIKHVCCTELCALLHAIPMHASCHTHACLHNAPTGVAMKKPRRIYGATAPMGTPHSSNDALEHCQLTPGTSANADQCAAWSMAECPKQTRPHLHAPPRQRPDMDGEEDPMRMDAMQSATAWASFDGEAHKASSGFGGTGFRRNGQGWREDWYARWDPVRINVSDDARLCLTMAHVFHCCLALLSCTLFCTHVCSCTQYCKYQHMICWGYLRWPAMQL